jgi:tRNA (guanine37-N1)-methyltransferase
VSIGDFVLAGGEAAALVVIESVVRLVPGVMGNEESVAEESFTAGLLEYPHYTRPASYRDWDVPEVLRSGDHRRVARWRQAQSLSRTVSRRPDLIEARGGLRDDEKALLEEFPDIAYPQESRGPQPPAPPAVGTAADAHEEPDAS